MFCIFLSLTYWERLSCVFLHKAFIFPIFPVDVPQSYVYQVVIQLFSYPFSGVIVTAFGGTCNAPWVNHADSCYLFVTHLKENWSEAVVTYKYFQSKISLPSHKYKNINIVSVIHPMFYTVSSKSIPQQCLVLSWSTKTKI